MRTRVEPRLDVLPAGGALSRLAELDLASQVRLLERLDLHRRPYDHIIIDAGVGIGSNVRLALSLAHEVLVVMNPEITSLTDAYALVKVACLAGSSGPFRVVVNRVATAAQSREIFSCLESVSGSLLGVSPEYVGFLYRDKVVERAVRAQRPFTRSFPEAPASRCLRRLTDRLLGIETATGKNIVGKLYDLIESRVRATPTRRRRSGTTTNARRPSRSAAGG